MFESFLGNARIVADLRRMVAEDRLPHTLLFAGPEGVGKATLARLLAATLNPQGARRILEADLSSAEHQKLLDERLKLSPEKRRDNPLVISTHPEFLTFPPDGPLAQISIEQVRKLKEYAQFGPSQGHRRVFLIDHADRMDGAAANSLLKVLEEPPPYLTLILTAENAYDLLPTIRSRSVAFYFAPLRREEMERFLSARPEIPKKVLSWAQGSPGRALSIDVPSYEKRREAMLAVLRGNFPDLLRHTETIARSKQEKLEWQLDALYGLMADLLRLKNDTGPLINEDIRAELATLAGRVDFEWLEKAATQVDALDALVRRNIQKQIALEALAVALRRST